MTIRIIRFIESGLKVIRVKISMRATTILKLQIL